MTIVKYYLISQIILLPALISYLLFRRKYNNYKQQWLIHRVILIVSLIIPLLLVFKPDYQLFSRVERSTPVEKEAKPLSIIQPIDSSLVLNESVIPEEILLMEGKSQLNITTETILIAIAGISFLLLLSFSLYEWLVILRLKRGIISREKLEGVEILVSSRVEAPFSYGVTRPSVFLPESLEKREKEIVLVHELNHIKGNHLLWLKAEVFLKKVFWFNPLYYLLNSWGNELRELLCDEASIRSVNTKEYGLTLVKSARKRVLQRDITCTYWGESSFLKKRVEKLLGDKSMPKGLNKINHILSFLVVILSVFIVPASSYALETGSVESNTIKAFVKASREKGALIASQDFDLNKVIASIPEKDRENYPLDYPMEGEFGRITQPWGLVKHFATYEDYFHTAIDIGFGFGKPIVASGNGKVVKVGYAPDGYGHYVVIEHKNGFYSLYGQMQNVAVKEGQKVKVGTYLAEMGSSGRSTGPHLHYSVFHDPKGDYFKGEKKEHDAFYRLSLNSFNFLPGEFKDSYISNYSIWLLDDEGNSYSADPSDISVTEDNGVLKFKRN